MYGPNTSYGVLCRWVGDATMDKLLAGAGMKSIPSVHLAFFACGRTNCRTLLLYTEQMLTEH